MSRLCELVERDAWTFAELTSQWIPWAKREALLGPTRPGLAGIPDACPRIDLSGADEPIAAMLEKFARNVHPIVRDMTSEFAVPCVIASVADDAIPDFPQAHSGWVRIRTPKLRSLAHWANSRNRAQSIYKAYGKI